MSARHLSVSQVIYPLKIVWTWLWVSANHGGNCLRFNPASTVGFWSGENTL